MGQLGKCVFNTLISTDSDTPYCNTVSFSSDIYDYACNNVDISTPQAITTAYEGQTSDRKFSPLVLTGEETSLTGPITGFGRPTPTGGEDAEDRDDGDKGGDNNGDDNGDDGGGSKKKKVNAGAIAGGVVGGVAVVGLIGLGVLFLLRRKKNKDPPPATAATQQATPGWTGPNSPQGGYASEFYKPGQDIQGYAQPVPPQQHGMVQELDRNSSASPRQSTLVGSPTAGYGYQGQFPQGVPAQGQPVGPQGQLPQGQPHQGQQPTQGQGQQGVQPMHELG